MIVTALVASLCACSSPKNPSAVDETKTLSPRVIKVGDFVPKGGGVFKIGEPYLAGGKWYVPVNDTSYDEVGLASWYGDFFHGRKTANGEIYDMNALTAAHPTLPMPTYAAVTNLANNRTVIVRINDRGPYHDGRIIDVSHRAAEELGFFGHGSAPVRVRYYAPAPLDGDDTLERTVLAKQPWAAHFSRTKAQPAPRVQPAPKMAMIPAPQITQAPQVNPPPQIKIMTAAALTQAPQIISSPEMTQQPQVKVQTAAALSPAASPPPAAATPFQTLVTKKGSFEGTPRKSGGGWMTSARPN